MVKPLKPPKLKKRPGRDGCWVELESEQNWFLIGQWKKRAEALRRYVPYLAAQHTYESLMGTIPREARWSPYRSILKVVRVGPKNWGPAVHAVYGRPKALSLSSREIDASRTVVYVRPKRNRLVTSRREAHVLEKYNPWTMETLPFSPKRNEAVLVLRKVRRREVQAVTEQRLRDKPKWQAELAQLGVRNVRKDSKPLELKTRTVQDVAFEALRLEFGYGGVRPAPHWRPSVRSAARYISSIWRKKNRVTSVLFKLKNASWRKWPPNSDGTIRIAELKNIAKFQKRLRIRV